jgi:hypothetical protein
MFKKATLVLFLSLSAMHGFSQKKTTKPAPSNDFNTKEAEIALLKALNKWKSAA